MQAIKAKDLHAYGKWNVAHKCSLNYKDSSLAMEKVSAVFKQSVTKHNLYCTSFYGDGDSKAFPALENTSGLKMPVKKYECISHYQKIVGASL